MNANTNKAAIVLGSYFNSYSIVQELHEKKVENIILISNKKKAGWYSNKVSERILYNNTSSDLLIVLDKLRLKYKKLVIFPTDDFQIEQLFEIYNKIEQYCFVPFNKSNVLKYSDKYEQYQECEKLGIPYPKTEIIREKCDLSKLNEIPIPYIIKPATREDIKIKIFRSIEVNSKNDIPSTIEKLQNFLDQKVTFIVSEIIPGDGSNIYAYIGYRSFEGKILNEWTGKKLSQYPNDYGVFASASNQASAEVLEQGRALLNGMNLYGINEPEFKYDFRDKKYKLMEINLRSMMWNRVGNLSGVNIQYTQWLDAIGENVEKQNQIKDKEIRFIYLQHEILNFLQRKKYWSTFRKIVFTKSEKHYGMFDKTDWKPVIMNFKKLLKSILAIIKLKFSKH